MAAREVERPGLPFDRARALAGRAGVLGAEGLGLLFQEGAERALDQAAADLQGQFLQDAQVDVQSRPLQPEGPLALLPLLFPTRPPTRGVYGRLPGLAGRSSWLASLAFASGPPNAFLFPC